MKELFEKCPYCAQNFDVKARAERIYKSKKENALASIEKAKANRTMGRKKIRNDKQINELRARGLTIRQIALKIGLSTTAVQRGLRTMEAK